MRGVLAASAVVLALRLVWSSGAQPVDVVLTPLLPVGTTARDPM